MVFKRYTIIVLVIVCVVPVLRWFFLEPVSLRFANLNATTTSLGQITGLLGMTLFAVNLILSNRSVFFDKIFSGLHRFYNIHRWIGALSFSLLLFHPLFLVFKYIWVSLRSAALFLLPVGSTALNAGIISLALMIILLVFTLFLKIKYNIWRISHKIMIVVFIFAMVHVFLIPSDISRDIFIRYYVLILSILGLVSGVYYSFFRIYFNRDYRYSVGHVNFLSDKIAELELVPTDKRMIFKPGQFVYVRFVDSGMSSEPHPFSISSPSRNKKIKIAIKSLGDFTNEIDKIEPGNTIILEGPFGSFFDFRKLDKDEIWIAGGVGITPFLSMARSLSLSNRKIVLYYCVSDWSELVFLDELQKIMLANKNFSVIPWVSKKQGRISARATMSDSGQLINKDIFICGPSNFMQSLIKQFISIGVNKKHIHFEEFNML